MKSFRHRSKLDPYAAEIQRWKNSGLSDRDIAAKLWQVHHVRVSYRTVNHYLHTHTDHKNTENTTPPPANEPARADATPIPINAGEQPSRPPAIQETLPLTTPVATDGDPPVVTTPPTPPTRESSPETQAALGYLHAEIGSLKQQIEQQQILIERQQNDLTQATQTLREGQTALRETLKALEAAQEATQRAIEERSARPELLTPEILPPLAWRRNLPEPWLTGSAPEKRRRLLAWLLQYVLPMLLTIGLLLAALSGHLTLSMFCPTNLPARLSLWGEQTLGLVYGWLIRTPILLVAALGGLVLALRSRRIVALVVLIWLLIIILSASQPRTRYFRQPGAYPGNRPAPQTPFLKPERCPRFPLA